jgi:hypothetical protein
MTTPKHITRSRLCAPGRLAALLLAASAFCLLAACGGSASGILDPLNVDNKEDVYKPMVGEPGEFGVVSIHEIIRYKRGADKEIEVESMFGDEIVVDKNPLLDSSDIISIEAIAVNDLPGFYKLRLHLTQDGGKIWRKLSLGNLEDTPSSTSAPSLAFLIDGVAYRTFKPRFLYSDQDTVIIDGPFDEPAALNLEANAIRNFMYFSQQ